MSDLETLIPPGVQITVAGETLTLKPLKVGSLPAFLRAISPVMQSLTAPAIVLRVCDIQLMALTPWASSR